MNPVDHVRPLVPNESFDETDCQLYSLMVVVTTNISVKPLQSLVMQHKVKKRVSLQLGGLVYCGELRRQRIEREDNATEQGFVDVWCMGRQKKPTVHLAE